MASILKVESVQNPSAGSPSIDIDSSGNVGIGTSSPNNRLVVNGGIAAIGEAGAGLTTGILIDQTASTLVRFLAYSATSSAMAWYTGSSSSASERMRLDVNGNLGIGTSSPSGKLHVAGTVIIDNANATNELTFSGTEFTNVLSGSTSGFQLGTTAAGYLAFLTNNTERARIDSSGNLGIGTTSPNGKLSVAGNITLEPGGSGPVASSRPQIWRGSDGLLGIQSGADTSGLIAFYTGSSGTPAERARIDASGNLLVGNTSKLGGGLVGIDINNASPAGVTFGVSGTAKGYLYTNSGTSRLQGETANGYTIAFVSGGTGGVSLANGATSWSAISDERLKTSVTPFQGALQKVGTLRAGTGRYLSDDESVSRSFLVAQDVQAVLPEAVDVESDEQGTLSLRYTDTIPLLVAAIQELKAENEALKARLDAAGL